MQGSTCCRSRLFKNFILLATFCQRHLQVKSGNRIYPIAEQLQDVAN